MGYFFFSNSEDGLLCEGPFDQGAALERIEDLTSEDLSPEYRAEFISDTPSWNTPTHHVCIVKGDVVVPEARKRVTEWTL